MLSFDDEEKDLPTSELNVSIFANRCCSSFSCSCTLSAVFASSKGKKFKGGNSIFLLSSKMPHSCSCVNTNL